MISQHFRMPNGHQAQAEIDGSVYLSVYAILFEGPQKGLSS